MNAGEVDLTARLGPLVLKNPIATASGTFGCCTALPCAMTRRGMISTSTVRRTKTSGIAA